MFAGVTCCTLERRLMQTRQSIKNTLALYSATNDAPASTASHSGRRKEVRANDRRSLVVKSLLMLVPGLLLLAMFLTTNIVGAHAASICTSNDITYAIKTGDTLNKIAARYGTFSSVLAKHNSVANPDLIYAGHTLCVPQSSSASNSTVTQQPVTNISASNSTTASQTAALINSTNTASADASNFYPYGQCTWWANERYHELHGVYVPWARNSDAWLWTTRAQQFGWHVSNTPAVGDILDLQPNVQGASNLGHVAVVEQVLSNNEIIASSMNWGADPFRVTDFQFTPGAGVTFIYQ